MLLSSIGELFSEYRRIFTCDWSFNFNHGLFRPEQSSAFIDDLESRALVDPTLQDEVLLQNV